MKTRMFKLNSAALVLSLMLGLCAQAVAADDKEVRDLVESTVAKQAAETVATVAPIPIRAFAPIAAPVADCHPSDRTSRPHQPHPDQSPPRQPRGVKCITHPRQTVAFA